MDAIPLPTRNKHALARCWPAAVVVGGALVVGAMQRAQGAIIAVDINNANTSSPTQSGTFDGTTTFTPFNAGNAQGPVTFSGLSTSDTQNGSIKLTLSGNGSADDVRDRGAITGSGSFTWSDLYRDFYFQNDNGTAGTSFLNFAITGLNASTTYSVALFSYDSSNPSSNYTYTVTTGTGNSMTLTHASPNANNFAEVVDNITTDPTGAFTVQIAGSNFAAVNGFAISDVPEPAATSLLAIGATGLLVRRRRRSNR